ncbi:MAG: TolC family protein [Polyangiaceae bacterium]|nr:TolC family protein [Polyangiaceae bacterium]
MLLPQAARADTPELEHGAAAPIELADAAPARAANGKKIYALPKILELTDKNHPNIMAARARLVFARGQLDEAHSAPFSQFKLSGGVTVLPELRGTSSYSPDNEVQIATSAGVALGWRVGLEGVLPLWTFGKIGHLWDAAEANVKVQEAGVEKERDLVRLEVRRAYYGLQLARDAKVLLADVKKSLSDAEKALEAKVEKDEADPIDLLKLQTFAAEVEVRESEADRFVASALAGLRFYSGEPRLDIPDTPLLPPEHTLLPVERYVEAAQKYRPEVAQARHGLAAREAQVRLAESSFYPDIGLGLAVGVGVAPDIDDQLNPFAYDPANYFRYGAGLVFQWNLDFAPKVAKLKQAKSELAEVSAMKKLATGGVSAEVEATYAEVADWKRRRDAYAKSTGYAKKWIIRVQQGIDVGTIEDKELLEPAKAYALGRFNVLSATMELDLAMAKLARVTGWDAIAPDGEPAP